MSVDHYNTLGVVHTASKADLRTAYLKLARANHPDIFIGAEREAAQARMQQINEAWNVLGVTHKRREYDSAQPKSSTTSAQSSTKRPTAQRGHAHFRAFDDDSTPQADIDDDATPIVGSKTMPRWMAFVPVGLVVAGVIIMAFGTMVNATGVFALGMISLGFGAACFLMLPLFVMSRAKRDPDL